jgi:hypothetical protein
MSARYATSIARRCTRPARVGNIRFGGEEPGAPHLKPGRKSIVVKTLA